MCIRDSPIHSLGIKVCLVFPDNSLSTVSEDLGLKYGIEELLLLNEKVPFFSGSGCVEGIQDFADILSPCLITEGPVP